MTRLKLMLEKNLEFCLLLSPVWTGGQNLKMLTHTFIIFIQIRHVTRAGLVEAGCSAITSLTLRQSDNSCQVDSSWLLFNFNPTFADVDFARTFLITQNQL